MDDANTTMTTIVCGPPCAGKSEFVKQNSQPGDTIIDFDEIARELGSPTPWMHPEPWASMAQGEFNRRLMRRTGRTWVIRSSPAAARRLADSLGAEVKRLDTDYRTCMERASARPSGTAKAIADWFNKFSPGG